MHTMKFRSMPDVATLVLRLALGLPVLIQLAFSFSSVIQSIQSSAILVIVFIVLGLGSLLLALGLFTRWAAAAIIIYYVVSGISYSVSGQNALVLIVSLVATLAPFVAVFLIGGGKYSLDQKISNRKKAVTAQM